MAKTQEEIFYDWLFGDEEYRKKHNPFSEILKASANTWPIVPNPKLINK